MSKVQDGSIHSDALDKQMAFSIYLPDGYNEKQRFPVLYFLHGRSGNESIIDGLDLKSAADELMASGQISPMMIVCPRMDNSRGLNTTNIPHQTVVDGIIIDTCRYEDHFIREVIPYIDRHFVTIPRREHRFVGDASAGGFAAVHYGLQYPELFSRIGGHMPAIETELDASDMPYYEDEDRNNPLEFEGFEELHRKQLWYLDAGNEYEGGFYNAVKSLSGKLKAHGIGVEHHIFLGHHNIQYIKDNIRTYLIFYGKRNIQVGSQSYYINNKHNHNV